MFPGISKPNPSIWIQNSTSGSEEGQVEPPTPPVWLSINHLTSARKRERKRNCCKKKLYSEIGACNCPHHRTNHLWGCPAPPAELEDAWFDTTGIRSSIGAFAQVPMLVQMLGINATLMYIHNTISMQLLIQISISEGSQNLILQWVYFQSRSFACKTDKKKAFPSDWISGKKIMG